MLTAPHPYVAPQRGFTLIETLIAMLLLCVGLVGVLGLKMASLKQGANSNSRAAAAIHAGDILDRLRANPVRARAGQYNLAIDQPASSPVTTIAQQDLVQWRAALASNFSDGGGSVNVTAGGIAMIVLRWKERDDTASARTQSFTFQSTL